MIEKGKEVTLEYTVFLEDNTQVDSSIGKEPLIYVHGSQQILPALEAELTGLDVGDTKKVILPPDNAYGDYNPSAVRTVESKIIPEEYRYPGAVLVIPNEEMGELLLRVNEVDGDQIVLDFNHPLAGKTLTFDVKILNVSQ